MSLALVPQLAAYIPRDRVEAILAQRPLSQSGVALIADISGFTTLTEALTKGLHADQGAEELTRALASVFAPLIEEVHQFEGSVIKFGGDALIVWFGQEETEPQAVINRALTSALRMQRVMEKHGQIQTPIGPVTLQMKIGLAYGAVKRFRLGLGDVGFEDVLAGETLDQMADAEHQAAPGDIVVSPSTYPLIEKMVTVQKWRGDYPILQAVKRPSPPTPWPALSWDEAQTEQIAAELANYVPRQIVERLLISQTQVAELRPVVSLFVQFHGLSYDEDPEIEQKLQQYFTTAQEVVSRYNGRLNRLITGDKGSMLHIIFGAPRTVEEQETRALRCAVDLQEACGTLPFIKMQRIGVAAGRVFAGPVGSDSRHDYTTMGDTINLSARLMQAAAADQILVETAVFQRANRTIIGDALEPIFVKGKADAIPVSAVTGHRMSSHTTRALPRLFGRERAMMQIGQSLARLAMGQGSVQIVFGEVGLGKSLFLDYVRAKMETAWTSPEKGMIASGLSVAYGEAISGYLFIDLLRDLLQVQPGMGPEQTRQKLKTFCLELFGEQRLDATFPYLARFMNLPLTDEAARRLDGLGGESLRWQIFELIPQIFDQLAEQRPLLLLFDDLQWSDPTSLQLIESIIPLAEKRPLMLLLASRPTTFSFAESSPVKTIRLKPVSDSVATQIIEFHSPEFTPGIVKHLVRRGEGNPLFLVELARTLKTSPLLQKTTDSIIVGALNLPDSVQGLLLAQIDRLNVDARNTLQMASVIGKTFLDRVLSFISRAELEVTAQLAHLEETDYIYPTASTGYGAAHIFRHGLVQESAYSTLLFERRREYHRRVAEALDQLFPTAVFEQASFLAHHYEQANEIEKAIYYLQLAADQSRLLFSHTEAEKLYNRTISLLETHQPHNREELARIWLKLAQVYANQADYETAQLYYERAFAYFDTVQEQREAVAVRAGEQRPFRWGLVAHEESFDPALVQSGEYTEILQNLYEGLIEVDDEWNIIPAVARRWEILENGRLYRFHLRPNLKWSDGHPLTAHDFVFAWERLFDPQTGSNMAIKLYDVKGARPFHTGDLADASQLGIRALDGLTLEIELESPSLYFLYLLAEPIAYPAPAHAKEKAWYAPSGFVGNGAYLLGGDGRSALTLTLNPHYRKTSPNQLATIQLETVEPSFDNYAADKVDWCRVEKLSDFNQDDLRGSKILIQGFVTYFLAFSCHAPPFDDAEVRRAFALAIDKEALVQEVWAGMPKPARGGMLPPGMPGHSPEIGLPFDVEQARELLGMDGRFPPINMVSITGFGETPEFLQQSWQRHLGIGVNIQKDAPIGESLAAIQKGDVHMLLLGISMGNPGPENILALTKGDSPLNYWGWQNSAYDTLLEETLHSTDLNERLRKYHQLDQMVVQEAAVLIPLYYQQAYGVIRPGFGFASATTRIRDQRLAFKNLRHA